MTDPNTAAENTRASILAMPIAQALKLQFVRVEPGIVELKIPVQHDWCFRAGHLQATAVFSAADFAAVGAAGTLLPPGWVNATIDTTLKLLAPAVGSHLIARGRVIKAARLLTICASDVFAVREGEETLCATFVGTARNLQPA